MKGSKHAIVEILHILNLLLDNSRASKNTNTTYMED